MKNYAFLFWGYLVVWAGLIGYFVSLGRRLASVSRRLDALESSSRGEGGPRAT
jgi:CcmD family protein